VIASLAAAFRPSSMWCCVRVDSLNTLQREYRALQSCHNLSMCRTLLNPVSADSASSSASSSSSSARVAGSSVSAGAVGTLSPSPPSSSPGPAPLGARSGSFSSFRSPTSTASPRPSAHSSSSSSSSSSASAAVSGSFQFPKHVQDLNESQHNAIDQCLKTSSGFVLVQGTSFVHVFAGLCCCCDL
jgi:hypothetical protein